jgi:hypothetical protein
MLWSPWCTRIESFLVLLEGMDAICRQLNHIYTSSCVFKMFKKIEKPAECEMYSVIRFLNARNMKPADFRRQLCEVYGERAMNDSMVRRWVRHFNKGRENLHDDRLWLTKIRCVQWKRRFKRTDDLPFRHFPCIFHKFHGHFFTKLSDKLRFQQLCSRWVPKMLMDEHKMKQAMWHA